MSDDVVERAKAALEGVTNGPWESTGGVVWRDVVIAVPDPSDPSGQTPMPEQVQEKVCDTSADDAEFIAAARTLVPELVAEVELLRAVLIDWAVVDHRQASRVRPVPVEGRVWGYRSPADGVEVLVRWDLDGWETADPALPSRWYTQDSSLLEWPGVFVELEQGFPR